MANRFCIINDTEPLWIHCQGRPGVAPKAKYRWSMSTYPRVPPSLAHKFGILSKDLAVHAVMLDRFGVIVAVNDQWKRFAEARGLILPDYGVGENYLRHCAFADPLSPRLVKGLSQLLAGEMDCVSLVYSCDTETEPTWFLLFGFPHPDGPDQFVLMHVDITVIVAAMARDRHQALTGADPREHTASGDSGPKAATIEQAILSTLAEGGDGAQGLDRPGGRAGMREGRQSALSKRQRDVLELMAKGMTNAEIAEKLGLSLNTVKVYVSGILARLGLQSRAQVLHWAFTRDADES